MTSHTRDITALRGVSGILVTPYDAAGAVRPDALRPIIDRLEADKASKAKSVDTAALLGELDAVE